MSGLGLGFRGCAVQGFSFGLLRLVEGQVNGFEQFGFPASSVGIQGWKGLVFWVQLSVFPAFVLRIRVVLWS